MTKLFPKLLLFTILFLVFPAVSFATSKIVILPVDPLTILPNTLSGQMTVQSQDENSVKVKTTEKINITFESSSLTPGEFFSATGNTPPKTIGSGDYNSNFSYKDSTEGTFTITVNAEGETTHQKWSATKQIIVSSSVSQATDPNPPEQEVLGASSDSSSSSSSQSSGESTTNVSSLSAKLEVSAGSDRVTSPGSPIWFQATVKKNTTGASLELNWSFGDGNVGVGPLVSHTYKYVGDYAVVLSARAGDIFSVSRLKVKVGTPEILISDEGEYLEIFNNGNTEINLFNWKIENAGKGFIFQPNTIILPKSSIKLDKSLLTMKGYDNSLGISLENSLREEVFAVPAPQQIPTENLVLIEIIPESFYIAQAKTRQTTEEQIQTETTVPEVLGAETTVTETEEISDNIIYEAPKKLGVLTRIWTFLTGVLP